jgi:hypothetical protein
MVDHYYRLYALYHWRADKTIAENMESVLLYNCVEDLLRGLKEFIEKENNKTSDPNKKWRRDPDYNDDTWEAHKDEEENLDLKWDPRFDGEDDCVYCTEEDFWLQHWIIPGVARLWTGPQTIETFWGG